MANITWIGTTGNAATGSNYSGGSVPTTGDNLTIPAGSGSITSGLSTLTGVVLGTVKIEDGYSGTIGVISAAALTYFQFECARLEVSGSGQYALNIETSNISPVIRKTSSGGNGTYGLYLLGSNIATLNCEGGNTVVAGRVGATSTIATLKVTKQAKVTCYSGVTLTTAVLAGSGEVSLDCALTTLTINSGNVTTTGIGAITTVNVYGGTAYLNSTGTITTLNIDGGTADFLQSLAARTVTTTNIELPGFLNADYSIVTFTNKPAVTGAAKMQFNKATAA